MNIHYGKPCAALRDHIRLYYLVETDRPCAQMAAAELANLRFDLAEPSSIGFGAGPLQQATAVNLVGVTTAAYRIALPSGARVFGMTLLPLGWTSLVGIGAADLSDQMVDFDSVAGAEVGPVAAEIAEAQTFVAMCAAADRYCLKRLERASARRIEAFPAAVQQWLVAPATSLDGLVDDLGVSRRQIDRLAHAYFGATPRLLQRKQKAVRAARLLSVGASFGEAAEDYCDQSHVIREFRRFIGETPGDYARGRAFMVEFFRRRAAALAGHPLAAL